MDIMDDENTVYCDVQISVVQGRDLLQLLTTLRESGVHPTL
jgi:hypothetical protein